MPNITAYQDGEIAALLLVFTRNSLAAGQQSFNNFQEQIDAYVAAANALGLPSTDPFMKAITALQKFYNTEGGAVNKALIR